MEDWSTVQKRTGSVLCAALIAFSGLAAHAATVVAETQAVLAEGEWQSDDAHGGGHWQAEFGIAPGGRLSGHIALAGPAGAGEGNVVGSLSSGRLQFRMLKTSGEELMDFDGVVADTTVTGHLRAADGSLDGSWSGYWTVREHGPRVPQSILDGLAAGQPQEIVVKFRDREILAMTARLRDQGGLEFDDDAILAFKATQFAAVRERVLSTLPQSDATMIQTYDYFPKALVRVYSQRALAALLAHPDIVRIFENEQYFTMLNQSLPLIRQPDALGAGYRGAGTAIAVLDTGVDYLRQVGGAYVFGAGCVNGPGSPGCSVVFAQDFAANDNQRDASGHGTNVAGIVHGVAPDTGIAALDVFTGASAYWNDVAAAINWAIANRGAFNIVGINMSLGTYQTYTAVCAGTSALEDEIADARNAGVISVVSSGNSASANGISNPACVPYAARVGAVYDANVGSQFWSNCTDLTTTADRVTCFSNSANFLTLLAPGALITAAGVTYGGTSQAAPHVAGATALLRAANAFPGDPLDCSLARLRKTGPSIQDARNGLSFRRLDVFAGVTTRPNTVGDCNGNGGVAANELNRGIDIALGVQPLSNCPSFDANQDGQVTIDELITGVNLSTTGCAIGESDNP